MDGDYRELLRSAMALAAVEHPHPNPRVGAVVLDATGAIVGRGAHVAAGTAHAEAVALAEAGDRARGGTVVVTLEPCSHEGRTPPCSRLLLDAGVALVIVGAGDPDPQVAGRGIADLRSGGVDVHVGVDGVDAEEIDPGYFHHRRTGRPRVTVKMAATLDGQAAAADGSSRWITSDEARRDAHELRSRSDAILVGGGTVLADDPELSVRLDRYRGRQPRPVVVAGRRPLPPEARVFARNPLVYGAQHLELPGELTVLPGPGGVDLAAVVEDLGKRDIVDLLVEGGPAIAGGFIRGGLVDRFVVYVAGAVAGGRGIPMVDGPFPTIADVSGVRITSVLRVGRDVRIEAEVG